MIQIRNFYGSAAVTAASLTPKGTANYDSPAAAPLHSLPQDLALARDLQDRMSMGRAYCNLGLAHAAIGNLENALECQKYFLGNINPPLNMLLPSTWYPNSFTFTSFVWS